MPEGNDPETTVSRERYEAVVRERDQLKEQVGGATKALTDYRKRDAARTALKGKVADPDSVADLITPHLAEVKAEDVADHIASDTFKPRLEAFKAVAAEPSPSPEGAEGAEPSGTEPATEVPGFGPSPSPGQGNGAQPLPGEQKIVVGSKEWDQLISSGDRDAVEAAYKSDRIVEPARGF